MKYVSLISFLLVATLSQAADLSNDDVIKMKTAGLSDSIILSAIEGANCTFDTSVDALLALKEAGVSEEVLKAMFKVPESKASAVPSVGSSETISPDVIVGTFDGKRESMRYLVPTSRTKARGLGFGGIATYMVLRGNSATLKIEERQPGFIVSIPENAQPRSYVDIASFAVRGNGSREVLIGGGYMSYSTGIHPDRRIETVSTKLEDQSAAKDGFVLYELKPAQPLLSGEYALIIYTSEIAVPGFFGTGTNSCFDFCIR